MKDLRERCEKLFSECMLKSNDGKEPAMIEAFAREIRNEALEEAAKEIQKDMHERFASVSHRAVCTPCDYKFIHGYYIRSLALAAGVPEDT